MRSPRTFVVTSWFAPLLTPCVCCSALEATASRDEFHSGHRHTFGRHVHVLQTSAAPRGRTHTVPRRSVSLMLAWRARPKSALRVRGRNNGREAHQVSGLLCRRKGRSRVSSHFLVLSSRYRRGRTGASCPPCPGRPARTGSALGTKQCLPLTSGRGACRAHPTSFRRSSTPKRSARSSVPSG